MPIEEFGSFIHFTVKVGESTMFILAFSILVAMDVDWFPGYGRFFDRGPDGLHQVQVLVLRVGQVIRFEGPKGVDVVACNSDGTLGDVVLGTDGIDTHDCSVVSSQFASEGIPSFDRTWDLVVAQQSVFRFLAFHDGGSCAVGAMERGITDNNRFTSGNGLGEVESIIIDHGMLHCPMG